MRSVWHHADMPPLLSRRSFIQAAAGAAALASTTGVARAAERGGKLDRVVRVACSPEGWWIIDFKWKVLETEQADYAMQLATYQSVFQRIRPQAQVSAKIITAHGDIWELQVGSGQNRIYRIPDARSRSPGEFAG